jgi:PAS domain S-box-containing protein
MALRDDADLAETVARLEEALARQTARVRTLNETSRAFSEAVGDYAHLLDVVARRAADVIGDLCTVRLISDDGAHFAEAAIYHGDEACVRVVRGAIARVQQRTDEGFLGRVLQGDDGLLVPELTLAQAIAATRPEYREALEACPFYSVVGAPLRAQGRTFGAISLIRTAPGRSYTRDDLTLLRDLADRAALAVANARMVDALRRTREAAEREVAARTEDLARVNARLKAHERFLESIVENIPDMIFVKDARELRFVRFNRAGEDLLGFDRDALIGKSDYDLFPEADADAFTAKDREVLAGRAVVDVPREPIHTRLQGTRLLHTRKVPVLDAEGRPEYLLGISEDITARVRAEEALARRTEELARSNRELEEFAYVASHDLQEPLRKISAFGEMLTEALGAALTPEGASYLARMRASAQRMQALINDLLAFSRVSTTGRGFSRVSLAAVVDEVLTDLEVRVRESGATVEVGPLPVVEADPVQMRQLMQNLLSNALKFRREGAAPRVRVSASDGSAPRCEVRVADDGIGFDERYLDRIFKPFQRLNAVRLYEGTGIGLAICRKIVERHGGTLTAASAPGAGATFTATLPWTRRAEPSAP